MCFCSSFHFKHKLRFKVYTSKVYRVDFVVKFCVWYQNLKYLMKYLTTTEKFPIIHRMLFTVILGYKFCAIFFDEFLSFSCDFLKNLNFGDFSKVWLFKFERSLVKFLSKLLFIYRRVFIIVPVPYFCIYF